jgi:hypothetical protein
VRKQNKEQMRRLSTLTRSKMPVGKGMKKESSKTNLKPTEEEKKEEI